MNGHAKVCQTLLSVGLGASPLDRDNYTPLMYAILRGNIDCVYVLLDEGKADLGSVLRLSTRLKYTGGLDKGTGCRLEYGVRRPKSETERRAFGSKWIG